MEGDDRGFKSSIRSQVFNLYIVSSQPELVKLSEGIELRPFNTHINVILVKLSTD